MKIRNKVFIPFLQALPCAFRGKNRLAKILLAKDSEKCEIPTRFGGIVVPNLVEPVAWDLARDGCYEPGLCRFIGQQVKTGNVCLDIGANIGAISREIAEQVGSTGRVHAFEPSPKIFQYLRKNTQCFTQITCHELALGRQTEKKIFYQAPDKKFGMGTFSPLPGWRATDVTVSTLDEFWEKIETPEIRFIKADVEGHELGVFQGGRETLLRNERVIIVFEFSDWAEKNAYGEAGESPRFLADLGFQLGSLDEKGRLHQLKSDLPKTGTWNLVACRNMEQRFPPE